MGLFNNFEKPGQGVDVDAPSKKGIALFLEVLWRKLSRLIETNFMYFIVSVPFFVLILLFIAPIFTDLVIKNELIDMPKLRIMVDLLFAGIIFNYYGSGPFSAGYAFITRSFTRSVPVWVVSDGFDKVKENFKKSLILLLTDVIIILLIVMALKFYGIRNDIISSVAYVIIIMFSGLYTMAHIFMYQIMITYECSVKDIIKTSLLFTGIKLPMCLLLMIATGVMCFAIFGLLGFFSVVVYSTIGMSLTRFPLEFYASQVIDKNIEKTTDGV